MSCTFLKKNRGGYTIIELLLAVSILTLVSTIILVPLGKFRDRQLVEIGAENIMSLVAQARTDTLSSLDDSEYGIHFESSRMVYFKGAIFIEPDVDNIEVEFDSRVEVSDISLNGGGSDVIFNRLTGETDEFGILTLEVLRDASTTQTVTIYGTGSMEKY